MGRIAGMATDHVAVMAHDDVVPPILIYGLVSLTAALASHLLPIETGGVALPENADEVAHELEEQHHQASTPAPASPGAVSAVLDRVANEGTV